MPGCLHCLQYYCHALFDSTTFIAKPVHLLYDTNNANMATNPACNARQLLSPSLSCLFDYFNCKLDIIRFSISLTLPTYAIKKFATVRRWSPLKT